jgi:MFS family permease
MYPVDAAAIGRARLAARKGLLAVSPVVLWLGVTSLFTDISSEMVLSALPAYLVLHVGLSPLQYGLIDGSYHGTTALLRIVSALFTDRLRRYKEMACFGYGLSALAKPVLLLGTSWPTIAGAVAADRVGKGIRTAPRDAIIGLSSPGPRLGTAFGVHRAMDAAGAMLGPLVAFGLLSTGGGFDSLFLTSFCVAIIGLAALVLFVRNPDRGASPAETGLTFRQLTAVLANRRFAAISGVAFVLGLATATDGFLLLLIQRRLGLPVSWFPLLAFAMAMVFMLAAAPFGRLADRAGRSPVFIGGNVAVLALYGCLLLAPGRGVAAGAVCLALLGLYYAATDGVLVAMASSVLSREVLTTGLAVLGTVVSLARVVASLSFGAAWSSFGEATAVGLFAAGLTVSLGLALPLLATAQRAE